MNSNLLAYQDMKIIIERKNLFSIRIHALLPSMSPDKIRFLIPTENGLMVDEIPAGQEPPKALLEMPADVFQVFIEALSLAANENGIKIERESELKGRLKAKEEELEFLREEQKNNNNTFRSIILKHTPNNLP